MQKMNNFSKVSGSVKPIQAQNGGTKGHSKPTGNTHAGPPPPPQPKQQVTKK